MIQKCKKKSDTIAFSKFPLIWTQIFLICVTELLLSAEIC